MSSESLSPASDQGRYRVPQPDIKQREILNWTSPSYPFSGRSETTLKRGGKILVLRGDEESQQSMACHTN